MDNATFFCATGAVLLLAAVMGTLLAPRPASTGGRVPRRGTMPPWALALVGLALASFALALDLPRVAAVAAAPFLLSWVLGGGRKAADVAPPLTPAPQPAPQAPATNAAAVLASLPPEMQAALAARAIQPPAKLKDFVMISGPPPQVAALAPATLPQEGDDADAARQRALDRTVLAAMMGLFALGLWQAGHRVRDAYTGFGILLLFYLFAFGFIGCAATALWRWGVWLLRR